MAITSASTLADIKGQYLDNADYEEAGSVSKAKLFITACRALLLKMPAQSGMGGGSVQLKPELINEEMQRARGWLSVNNEGRNAGTKHLSFKGFRR